MDLVVGERLEVYRVGYHRTRRLTRALDAGPGLAEAGFFGLCWHGLLAMLQPRYAHEPMIPVMDGFDAQMVAAFSRLIRSGDVVRASGYGAALSLEHTENILGEVFYADSRFSVFTQVVDVVAYLRHIADKARMGKPVSDFHESLCRISERIAPPLIREEIVTMQFGE